MNNVELDQEACSPVRGERDNLAIIYSPLPPMPGGDQVFLAAIMAHESLKGEVPNIDDMCGEAKHTSHFVRIPPDTFKFPAENELTHFACVEAATHKTMPEGAPFLFGTDWVAHDGAILMYSEPRNKYYFFHCRTCAYLVLNYIAKHQSEWHKEAATWAKGSAALN